MRIRAAGDQIGAALLKTAGKRLGVGDHRLGIGLELGLQRLAERHGLGGDDVHQRAALEAGEDRRIDLLGDGFVVGQDHAAARAAQGLVRGRRHDMRMAEGRRVLTRGDEAGKMRHIHQEKRSHLIADFTKALEVEVARVSGAAGDDQLRLVLSRKPLDFIEIDEMVVAANAILDSVEPLA